MNRIQSDRSDYPTLGQELKWPLAVLISGVALVAIGFAVHHYVQKVPVVAFGVPGGMVALAGMMIILDKVFSHNPPPPDQPPLSKNSMGTSVSLSPSTLPSRPMNPKPVTPKPPNSPPSSQKTLTLAYAAGELTHKVGPVCTPSSFFKALCSPKEYTQFYKTQVEYLDQHYLYQPVKGDGNCFYTAAFSGLMHTYIADYIKGNKQTLATFLEQGKELMTSYTEDESFIDDLKKKLSDNPNSQTLRDLVVDTRLMLRAAVFIRQYAIGRLKEMDESILQPSIEATVDETFTKDYQKKTGYGWDKSENTMGQYLTYQGSNFVHAQFLDFASLFKTNVIPASYFLNPRDPNYASARHGEEKNNFTPPRFSIYHHNDHFALLIPLETAKTLRLSSIK